MAPDGGGGAPAAGLARCIDCPGESGDFIIITVPWFVVP